MAHFVTITESGTVIAIHVLDNAAIVGNNGEESEAAGIAILSEQFGDGLYLQASYNGKRRRRYPAVGDIYDFDRDMFHPPDWVYVSSLGDYCPREWDTGACPSCHCHEPPAAPQPLANGVWTAPPVPDEPPEAEA